MTKHEVLMRAIAKEITWIQAAQICGISDRQMRRLKREFERRGYEAVIDQRGRTLRRQRIALATLEQVCALKRERYADFSVQHFWEKLTAEHGTAISHLDQADLAGRGLGREEPGAWALPPPARAAPPARADGPPRCLPPSLAARAADAGLGGGDGRRGWAHPVCPLRPRGRDRLHLRGAPPRGDHLWPLRRALHRSRQSLAGSPVVRDWLGRSGAPPVLRGSLEGGSGGGRPVGPVPAGGKGQEPTIPRQWDSLGWRWNA